MMINVLVVEDSAVVRELLVRLLGSDPEIRVLGTAQNGEEALEFIRVKKPDVITMDINMPRMNGFEATRRIMETTPTPIVVVSGSWAAEEVARTFRALEAGALAAVSRPVGPGHPNHESQAKELVNTVKLMSEVKVVRRWPRTAPESRMAADRSTAPAVPEGTVEAQVVAMGASTGGPVALHTILSRLNHGFPVPLLVVQHMAPGFIHGFVEWMAQSSAVPVKVAGPGEWLRPGQAYVAPDGFQMGVTREGRIALLQAQPENGLRPSVSYLFRSVAAVFGQKTVAVLLSGMGADGAAELKILKDQGAVTLVQNQESSVVFGMPGEAVGLGAATYVLPPEGIADRLIALASRRDGKKIQTRADEEQKGERK